MIKRGNMEWNLNTLLQLGTIASFLVVGGMAWQDVRGDIEVATRWREAHDLYHKERLVATKEIEGRNDERFKSNEADIRKALGMIETIVVRQSMSEQSQSAVLQAVKELQASQSEYNSEQRVQREILQRIEASLKTPR